MKKFLFPCLAGLIALFSSLSALAAVYNQTVIPSVDANGTAFPGGAPYTLSVGTGQSFTFYGRYNATLDKTTGLGLNISFDGTKIANVTIDSATVLTKCLLQLPVVSGQGTASGQVQIVWADTGHRGDGSVGWPGAPDSATNGVQPPDPTATYPCIVPPACTANVNGCPAVPPPLYTPNTSAVPVPTTLFKFTANTVAGSFPPGSTTDIVITASGKAAPPDPVNDTTTFTTQTLRITGITPPLCNLDVDLSGATTAGVDGILIRRSLNSLIQPQNITNGISFPGSATRTDGALIRQAVLAMGNVLDVDGQGATAPVSGTDGLMIQRALNPLIQSANITNNITTTPAGVTGSQVRTYLNTACNAGLVP